ncbi:MAG: hypothetical protein N3A38_03215 [Planctomycetota bacterium]|nr:hypothetical protein [Planctomycetota bacterium]
MRKGTSQYVSGVPVEWALSATAFVLFFAAGPDLPGATMEEARTLHKEGKDLLVKAGFHAGGDPKLYGEALKKFEQSAAILEELSKGGNKDAASLLEEVNSQMFWARKFAPLDVGGPSPVPRPTPKPPDVTKLPDSQKPSGDPGRTDQAVSEAEKEYRRCEEFEKAHAGDFYAISLRYFEMADRFAGTDWAVKALGKAREYQQRHKDRLAAAEKKKAESATPEEKLVAEGDALLRERKYDEAAARYADSLKIKETVAARRGLGHVLFEKGKGMRDEYASRYYALYAQYLAARRIGDKPGMKRAADAVSGLKSLADRALAKFGEARREFENALKLAGGKDLDSDVHAALTHCFHTDAENRIEAKKKLRAILDKYKAEDDEQRVLLEYARTELARLERIAAAR